MFLAFCFLGFLVLVSLKQNRKSFVFSYSLWYLIMLADYAAARKIFVPFSDRFELFFFYFSFLFVFAYLLFDEVITHIGIYKERKFSFYSYKTFFLFSVFLAFVSLFICAKAVVTLPILEVRSKIAGEELSFHVGLSFPFVSACLFYQNINGIKKNRKFLLVLLFLLAVISTSKQFIVLMFLYSVPWYKKDFKFRFLPFLLIGLFGFIFILILHALTGRVAGSGNLVQKTLYTINGYFLGGLAVFQLFLDGTMEQHITSGAWVKTGKWIGNVYSGFYNFFYEQSYLLLSVRVLFISLLYAFLNFRRKSVFAGFLRIYSIYPLLFFIFADLYVPAVKQWLIFVFAGAGISFIKNRKLKNANLCTHNAV